VYGSTGFNSNGTCMNVNNQISARPGIRVYAGIASGGSYSSIFGGEETHSKTGQGKAASRILKETQNQGDPTGKIGAPCDEMKREDVGRGLARRTVIDAGSQGAMPMAAPAYVPQERQERPARALSSDEQGGAQSTSLTFGGGNDGPQRGGRRGAPRQQPVRQEVPEWMGGGYGEAAAAPQHRQDQRRQIIDCSPPSSQDPPAPAAGRRNYKAQQQQEEVHRAARRGGQQVAKSELQLGYDHGDRGGSNTDSYASYSTAAQQRMKARPF